jgi:hypothetical protein
MTRYSIKGKKHEVIVIFHEGVLQDFETVGQPFSFFKKVLIN